MWQDCHIVFLGRKCRKTGKSCRDVLITFHVWVPSSLSLSLSVYVDSDYPPFRSSFPRIHQVFTWILFCVFCLPRSTWLDMIIQSKIYTAILKAFLMHYALSLAANIHTKRHFNGEFMPLWFSLWTNKNVREFSCIKSPSFFQVDETKTKTTNFSNVCF